MIRWLTDNHQSLTLVGRTIPQKFSSRAPQLDEGTAEYGERETKGPETGQIRGKAKTTNLVGHKVEQSAAISSVTTRLGGDTP